MAYGTVNADIIQSSVSGVSLGAGNASIMKNRIINGAMVIDQRNAGASITPAATQYLVDRWFYYGTQASKFTAQQNQGSVTPPAGFVNYQGVTVASAVTVGAGDTFFISQCVEGYNIADLNWGTVNAKTVTVSFWAYSSLTGTFSGSIRNSVNNYSYPFTYSIPVANTWTQISITIAGPTGGTWNITNTQGLNLAFNLGSGSSFSGTAGSWSANQYLGATGANSIVATAGATFYITGVQLEVGSSATGFEYRQYGQELALCQRYYEKSYDQDVKPATNGALSGRYVTDIGTHSDGTSAMTIFFKVNKRSAGYSAAFYAANGTSGMDYARSGASGIAPALTDNKGNNSMVCYCTTGAPAWTETSVILFQYVVDAEL